MYPKKHLYGNNCYGQNMAPPTSRPQYDGRQKPYIMSFSSGDDETYCNLFHRDIKTSLTRSNEISRIVNNERRRRILQAASASFRSMDESYENSIHRDDMKSSALACHNHKGRKPRSRTMSFLSSDASDEQNSLRQERPTVLAISHELSNIMICDRRNKHLSQGSSSFQSTDDSTDNNLKRLEHEKFQPLNRRKRRKPRSRTMSFLSTDDASDNNSVSSRSHESSYLMNCSYGRSRPQHQASSFRSMNDSSQNSIHNRDFMKQYPTLTNCKKGRPRSRTLSFLSSDGTSSSGRTLTTQASSFRSKDDDSYNTIETQQQQQQQQGKKLRSHTMSFLPQDDSYDNLVRQEFRSHPKQINKSSHFMLKRNGSSCQTSSMANGSINDSDDDNRHQTSQIPTSKIRRHPLYRDGVKSSSSHTMLCQLNNVNLDYDDDDTIVMEDIDLSVSLNNVSTPTELLEREIEQLKSDLIEAKAELEEMSAVARELEDENDQLQKIHDEAIISNRDALIFMEKATIEIFETRAYLKESYKDLVWLSWNKKNAIRNRLNQNKCACLVLEGYMDAAGAVKNMLNAWRPSSLFSSIQSSRDERPTIQKIIEENAQSMSTRLLKNIETEICDNVVIPDDDDYRHQQGSAERHDVEMEGYLQKFSTTSSRWVPSEGTVTKQQKTDRLLIPSFDEGSFHCDPHRFSTHLPSI